MREWQIASHEKQHPIRMGITWLVFSNLFHFHAYGVLMTASNQRIRGDESRDAVFYSLLLRFSSRLFSLLSFPSRVSCGRELNFWIFEFGKCDRRIYNNKYIILYLETIVAWHVIFHRISGILVFLLELLPLLSTVLLRYQSTVKSVNWSVNW